MENHPFSIENYKDDCLGFCKLDSQADDGSDVKGRNVGETK